MTNTQRAGSHVDWITRKVYRCIGEHSKPRHKVKAYGPMITYLAIPIETVHRSREIHTKRTLCLFHIARNVKYDLRYGHYTQRGAMSTQCQASSSGTKHHFNPVFQVKHMAQGACLGTPTRTVSYLWEICMKQTPNSWHVSYACLCRPNMNILGDWPWNSTWFVLQHLKRCTHT